MKKGNIKKRILALFLVMTMVFTSIQVLPTETVGANSKQQKRTFNGEGFQVNFNVTSQWKDTFNAQVEIKNTSSTPIDNWSIGFYLPYEISKIWKGEIDTNDDGLYIIKNVCSNQDIMPKSSVSFGFIAKGTGELNIPQYYLMLNKQVNVYSDNYETSFKITRDWNSVFNGELIIKNISDKTIEDWSIEFDYPYQIESFLTANIVSHIGNHYIVKNAGYNANIKAGECLSLGFSVKSGKVSDEPQNISMKQIKVIETSLGEDPDDDRLETYIELTNGTDPYCEDTDGDKLSDWFEIIINSNPVKKDSNGDGIFDGDEDLDDDKLTILEEIQYDTDNMNPDTDSDRLSDYDEIYLYHTDPLDPDGDRDEIYDGDEVKLGLDPNSSTTNGKLDKEYCTEQSLSEDANELAEINCEENPYKISVEMNVAGCITDNLYATESEYANAIQNDATLGMVPEFIYNDSMKVKSVRIKFHISSEFIPHDIQENEELRGIKRYNIFKYFDDYAMLLPVKTKFDIENNIIYADVDELGTYCVIDLVKWVSIIGNVDDDSEIINPVYGKDTMIFDTYNDEIRDEKNTFPQIQIWRLLKKVRKLSQLYHLNQ